VSQTEQLAARLIEGGEAVIDELIEQRESEAVYLDFKRAATTAGAARLDDSDQKNLAKAISGFGNTSGGVVIWGVDCRDLGDRGDVAQAKFPVPNVRRFLSWLEAQVSRSTIPLHPGIQNRLVAERPDGSGFVVTEVPQAANAPLQVASGSLYYLRAGSSFSVIPHGILAAMFGRRPTPLFQIDVSLSQPALPVQGELLAGVQVSITNIGAGVARDVFITIEMLSRPHGDRGFGVGWLQDPQFERPTNGPISRSAILLPGRRMQPGAHAVTFPIELRLARPIEAPLDLRLTCGADNAPPSVRTLAQTQARLEHCCDLGIELASNKPIDTGWLARRMFGLIAD
jgi:schlafen family protein